MKTYSYAATALHEFMQQLSFDLKVPLINNKVELPETIGSGFIKSMFLEEDCCLRFYHVNLREDIVYKWFTDTHSDQPMFKLVFSLASDEDFSHSFLHHGLPVSVSENNAVLYSTDFSRKAIVPRGRWINRLVMVFTHRWLENNFTEANEQIAVLLNQMTSRYQPTLITQMIDAGQYEMACGLASEISKEHFPLLHIKTMSLQIISNFLDRIVSKQAVPQNLPIALYPQMTEVEKTISEYYEKQMPNISELAAQFNMSSATLKRHFKIVYGKSIYQYYLEKKMAVGKDLICMNHKSVSEVAYMLGYNKINSFSRVFKKCYGVLPREMNSMRSIA